MKVVEIVLLIVLSGLGTVRAQTNGAELVNRCRQVAQTVENLIGQCQNSLQHNGCQALKDYEDAALPKPGMPMRDLSFEWELGRRQLRARCEFERVVEQLQALEAAVARWDAACKLARQGGGN